MPMYMFDACTCIDFLRGDLDSGYQIMQESGPQLFKIPAIVAGELFVGVEKAQNPRRERLAVERFLLPFEIVPFDFSCAREYSLIRAGLERRGMKIGHNDLLIAATARAHGATLVTSNVREFKRVPDLRLETWGEIDW